MNRSFCNFILLLSLFLTSKFYCQDSFQKLTENFDGRNIIFQENLNWRHENRELKFTGGVVPDKIYFRTIPGTFSDFTVSVDAKWLGEEAYYGFGIYFRGSEKGYYLFEINANGYYCLKKYNGEYFEFITDSESTGFISLEEYNPLQVTCVGNNIKCYALDFELINITDNSFLNGSVGVYASGGGLCAFDNFSITPSEK